MKKIFAACALVCLLSLPAFSSGLLFHFGAAITDIKYSETLPPDEPKKATLQFTGGFGYELSFTQNIALEFDLVYAPGGTSYTHPWWGGSTCKHTIKGYGIGLPVVLKISFLSSIKPYIVGGGMIGYTLSQKETYVNEDGSDEWDLTDDVNRFQYGLVFGGGVEFGLGSMRFYVEGRYIMGLSNLFKNPWPGEKATIQNIFIVVGYKI